MEIYTQFYNLLCEDLAYAVSTFGYSLLASDASKALHSSLIITEIAFLKKFCLNQSLYKEIIENTKELYSNFMPLLLLVSPDEKLDMLENPGQYLFDQQFMIKRKQVNTIRSIASIFFEKIAQDFSEKRDEGVLFAIDLIKFALTDELSPLLNACKCFSNLNKMERTDLVELALHYFLLLNIEISKNESTTKLIRDFFVNYGDYLLKIDDTNVSAKMCLTTLHLFPLVIDQTNTEFYSIIFDWLVYQFDKSEAVSLCALYSIESFLKDPIYLPQIVPQLKRNFGSMWKVCNDSTEIKCVEFLQTVLKNVDVGIDSLEMFRTTCDRIVLLAEEKENVSFVCALFRLLTIIVGKIDRSCLFELENMLNNLMVVSMHGSKSFEEELFKLNYKYLQRTKTLNKAAILLFQTTESLYKYKKSITSEHYEFLDEFIELAFGYFEENPSDAVVLVNLLKMTLNNTDSQEGDLVYSTNLITKALQKQMINSNFLVEQIIKNVAVYLEDYIDAYEELENISNPQEVVSFGCLCIILSSAFFQNLYVVSDLICSNITVHRYLISVRAALLSDFMSAYIGKIHLIALCSLINDENSRNKFDRTSEIFKLIIDILMINKKISKKEESDKCKVKFVESEDEEKKKKVQRVDPTIKENLYLLNTRKEINDLDEYNLARITFNQVYENGRNLFQEWLMTLGEVSREKVLRINKERRIEIEDEEGNKKSVVRKIMRIKCPKYY